MNDASIMNADSERSGDSLLANPLIQSLLVCLAFFLLCLPNLEHPTVLYFDESYYAPAGKRILELDIRNREHPMLAKEIIAAFIYLFGDTWISIRIGSVIWGTLGLFGFQRALYYFSGSAEAALIFGLLVIGNCLYFTTARAALLDPYMIGFAGLSTAFYARGWVRERGRAVNFALSGLLIGLSIACKWSIVPFAATMGIALIIRYRSDVRSLTKYCFVFGGLAIPPYIVTFIPLLFDAKHPLAVSDFFAFHRMMFIRLGLLVVDHPYTSFWWQWPLGGGQMWLYDGLYNNENRVIILGQNPASVIISLPSVCYGIYRLVRNRDWLIGSLALGYIGFLGFWKLTEKPIMFLYHYNIASLLALAIFAISLSRLKVTWKSRMVGALFAGYFVCFFLLFPAISGTDIGPEIKYYRNLPYWSVNPKAAGFRKVIGNGKTVARWSQDCLDDPRKSGCDQVIKNTEQDKWRYE